ncbi:lipid A-modifier LpxR family protein [Sulfuricella sp.]
MSGQWQGVKVTYAHHLRGKEFETQDAPQGYGSITLSLEY